MSKHSHNNSGEAKAAQENTRENENPENSEKSAENAAVPPDTENNAKDHGPADFSLLPPEAKIAALGNELADWVQKYADLEVKLADLNDQYLRKAADFENFRKRMIREKQEITDFANQNLLLDLLPVIDDFERAIKSAQSSPAAQSSKDFTSFYEGIVMIEKRLTTELENKWGLKRFNSEGELFDPIRHEALQMEKAAGISEAVVKEDFVKGYLLKDRVIRFAKVKVLMPDGGTPVPAAGEGT